MAFFFFFFCFVDDDDGRPFVPGEGGGGRFECVWTNWCEGLGIGTTKKEHHRARSFGESLSLSLDACPKLESSTTTLRVVGAKKYGSLSLLRTKRERLKCMCTDEKRTCDTAFVCATKVLCSLSAENLPKKSVCVFRRRHSPTEEEKEEKEEEKEERRNARRKRAAAAFRRREEASSGRERERLSVMRLL